MTNNGTVNLSLSNQLWYNPVNRNALHAASTAKGFSGKEDATNINIVTDIGLPCYWKAFSMADKYNGTPCSICGETLRYALGNCVKCARERRVRRYAKKRDEEREYMRQYQIRNKAAFRDRGKKWYEENRQHVCAKSQQWREKNPERASENVKRWKRENPDRVVELNRRRRVLKSGGIVEPYDFKAICESYGNRCLACGRDDVKLTIDHIIPISKGGGDMPSNIQPLCGFCNNSKGVKETDYRPLKVGKNR